MKINEKRLLHRVPVDLGERSYDVLVGSGLIDDVASLSSGAESGPAMLVTNVIVEPLLGERVRRTLQKRFRKVHTVVLPDGEARKTWATLHLVFDALLEARCDRNTTVVALGGGVVGDVAGFAAACYMRGVSYIQVPTTLLAQVDSSVGGKTAINHPAGKNMIGAFHQPRRVVADVEVLKTLPRRELVAGLAEVIKYGAIVAPDFLGWIDEELPRLLALEADSLAAAVSRSCRIKAEIVAADERESGLRAVLNFGHTFAHAIEAAVGYGEWLHGEAVGCGMVLAARLSVRLGLIDARRAERLQGIIARAGLPTRPPKVDAATLIEWMRVDKKAVDGSQRFVLLQGVSGTVVMPAPERVVESVIEECLSV